MDVFYKTICLHPTARRQCGSRRKNELIQPSTSNYIRSTSFLSSVMNLDSAQPVQPPVRGRWVALNSPASRVPSHGTDRYGQRYAIDFAVLNRKTNSFSTQSVWRQCFLLAETQYFHCWNRQVHAIFDGRAVKVSDGWCDRVRVNLLWELFRAKLWSRTLVTPDLRELLGNFVILEGNGCFALFAHLRNGSIVVQEGKMVKAGEVLGAVGCSGNSTQPHLHFQLMDGPDPRSAGGVPFAFMVRRRAGADSPQMERFVPRTMEQFRALGRFCMRLVTKPD